MLPDEVLKKIKAKLDRTEHPGEVAVDVMYALQKHYGYLSDEALTEGAELLGMTPLKLDEIATFYDFIYRSPVGKYVIHLCDGVICRMFREETVMDYLCRKLDIKAGGTSRDGLFTLLPAGCIGFCDHAPAMLVNGKFFGKLTPESIDAILQQLRDQEPCPIEDK